MSESIEHVILVDTDGREIGISEKLEAHRTGALHRAFSVMIWDRTGRLLLQKRHTGKYHSGGLWTNSCCGHPRPGEDTAEAASRRLREEMGFACPLKPIGVLRYRADVGVGLVEHEYVYIFHGRYDGAISPSPTECDDFAWVTPDKFRSALATEPQRYTAWFSKYVEAGWPVVPSFVAAE